MIRNAEDMEKAVKSAAYPPFISCQTTYSKEVRRTGVPTKVVLQIEGVKDKAMPFLCTAYEYRSESEYIHISKKVLRTFLPATIHKSSNTYMQAYTLHIILYQLVNIFACTIYIPYIILL